MIQRIYEWWASVPARSWFAHGFVSLAIMMAGAMVGHPFDMGRHGAMIGASLAMFLYIAKELGDWYRYLASGRMNEAHGGATRRADGWGDLVGPFFVALTSLAWFLF